MRNRFYNNSRCSRDHLQGSNVMLKCMVILRVFPSECMKFGLVIHHDRWTGRQIKLSSNCCIDFLRLFLPKNHAENGSGHVLIFGILAASEFPKQDWRTIWRPQIQVSYKIASCVQHFRRNENKSTNWNVFLLTWYSPKRSSEYSVAILSSRASFSARPPNPVLISATVATLAFRFSREILVFTCQTRYLRQNFWIQKWHILPSGKRKWLEAWSTWKT